MIDKNKIPFISAIVLTYNEEENINSCLNSLQELSADIFIVDSYSTDKTLEIAREYTDNIYQHTFTNQAEQFNWALGNLPIQTEWVLRLDADEWLTADLSRELKEKLHSLPEEITGLYMKRRVYFMGRWIKHGGYYPTWLLRVFRLGQAKCEQKNMDEHIVVLDGQTLNLSHDIIDENHKGLSFWIDKHNKFSSREMVEISNYNAEKPAQTIQPALRGNAVQKKRWFKENIYLALPLFIRSLFYFIYRYIIKLGFLDGKEGLIFHFLQGFWYRFLVDAKIFETRKNMNHWNLSISDSCDSMDVLSHLCKERENSHDISPGKKVTRLLCIIPRYWPAFRHGGMIVAVHNLNKALAKKGVQVIVYTSDAGLEGKVPVNKAVDVEGVQVVYFKSSHLFDFVGDTGWQFSTELTRALKQTINRFDIVHINGIWSYPAGIAAYYCRKYQKPYIISPHGMLFPYTLSKKSWKKWPYYALVTKRDLQNATAIHFLTEYEKSKVHPSIRLIDNSFILANGIDFTEHNESLLKYNLQVRYPQLKNKKVILFLGRLNWKKGLDILVMAFSRLLHVKKDVHLLIAGPDEGGYSMKVKKWIKEKGIEEHVTLTGMLDGSHKIEALVESDLFVLPSYSEGLSISMLEAMHYGLPMIISDQSHFPEILQYNAGKVVPCDINSVSNAMEELIDNDALRLSLGENGKKLVIEKFSSDVISEAMLRNYKKTLKEHDLAVN